MADSAPPSRPLIGLLVRLIYQHHSQDIQTALADAGFDDITPAHANVFSFVPDHGISVSDLAELAHVRKQTMGQAVEQLEQLGYIQRRPNPADRRSRLVFLTDRGASVRPTTHAAATQVEQHWAQLTSPAELEALRTSLQHLLDTLRSASASRTNHSPPTSEPPH